MSESELLVLHRDMLVLTAQLKALEDVLADLVADLSPKGGESLSAASLKESLAHYRKLELDTVLEAMAQHEPLKAAKLKALCHELPPPNQTN